MKNQYVADINDFFKYGLLRALCAHSGLKLGVCWMLTPDVANNDGRKRHYLDQPTQYRACDKTLFDELDRMASPRHRKVAVADIEQSKLLGNARYWQKEWPANALDRTQSLRNVLDHLRSVDLVFFDPDNGIETPGTQSKSAQHLRWEEVLATWERGHSVFVYQHLQRVSRQELVAGRAQELTRLTGAITWSVLTKHVLFLLAAQPRHRDSLANGFVGYRRLWSSVTSTHCHGA